MMDSVDDRYGNLPMRNDYEPRMVKDSLWVWYFECSIVLFTTENLNIQKAVENGIQVLILHLSQKSSSNKHERNSKLLQKVFGAENISISVRYSNVDVVDRELLERTSLTGNENGLCITDVIDTAESEPVMKNMYEKKPLLKDLWNSVSQWQALNHYSKRNSQKKWRRSMRCRLWFTEKKQRSQPKQNIWVSFLQDEVMQRRAKFWGNSEKKWFWRTGCLR